MRYQKQFHRQLPALLSVIAVALLAGCGSSDEPSSADASERSPSSAALATGSGAGSDVASAVQHAAPHPGEGPEELSFPQGLSGPKLGASTPGTAQPANPVVEIETSLGVIRVKLLPDKAPITVQNFLSYLQNGFYDGTIFHQVFPGAVILGGQYTPDYQARKPGQPIFNEAHNGLKNVRGTIAMARQYNDTHSATCQFFINVKDNPNYDYQQTPAGLNAPPEQYGYCVFGEVTAGMDVVDRIANVPVHDVQGFERTPVEPVVIRSVRQIQ